MRAAVAIPAAARWTDRQAIAVRFVMFNMVASFGAENDGGDVSVRGSEVVVGGEGGGGRLGSSFECKKSCHRSVTNLRKFRIHPTDSPIAFRPLGNTCLIAAQWITWVT